MPKSPPAALGDAYPALRNFLKLTALTLEVSQVALTVQVGSRPYSTGALSYGPMTQAALRQMLQQPPPALAPITETLSLGTLYRSAVPASAVPAPPPENQDVAYPEGASAPTAATPTSPFQSAMVGRIHPPKTSYYLTLYIPGIVAESLAVSQVKTLAYLTQQLLLCLRLTPLPPELVPPPLPSQLGTANNASPGASGDLLDEVVPPSQDFLARVVSINPPRLVGKTLMSPQLPSLVDLEAGLQACLSYNQLGKVLKEYLPPFFPQQAGQLTLISGSPPQSLVLTHWGQDQRFQALVQQCPLLAYPTPAPRQGLCTRCHPSPTPDPHAGVSCTILGHLAHTTCLLQVTRLDRGPSPLQTTLLQKLSEHMIYVMQRLLVLEDLQSQATHDSLTGLLNRRPMETVLKNLCQADNRQQAVSLILIDIDHFKVINDTFGHLVGDQVLKHLSVLLRGHVRSQDVVCRYGGEEFCMVLFDAPLSGAISRAEKIRRAVKYLTLTHEGRPIEPLTISLGISCFPVHGHDPDALLQRADQALYWAKSHGRDRTATADEATTGP